jgi:hypothetical protein
VSQPYGPPRPTGIASLCPGTILLRYNRSLAYVAFFRVISVHSSSDILPIDTDSVGKETTRTVPFSVCTAVSKIESFIQIF